VELLQDVLEFVLAALGKSDLTLDSSNNIERADNETMDREEQIETVLNRMVPMNCLFLRTFHIPRHKFLNAMQSSRVPADERVVAIIDLSPVGSAKNAIVIGIKGIYFSDSKGVSGFVSYKELCDEKVTGDDSEIIAGKSTISLGNIRIKPSSLVTILEALKESLFYTMNTSSPETKKKKKKKKSKEKEKERSDSEKEGENNKEEQKEEEKERN